jgi:hypothetical protein
MVEDAWTVKLQRAAEHIGSLEAEVASYLSARPAHVTVEPHADGATFDLRLSIRQLPPQRWSALIGDALHNIRSALDSRTFSIVMRYCTSPLTEAEQATVQFPITIGESTYERATRWHSRKAPAEVVAAFARVQPWAESEGPPDLIKEAAQRHPLVTLQRLSNIDKHRALHPTLCGLDFMSVGLPEGAEADWVPVDPWPWSDGAVVARCVVRNLQPGCDPEFGDFFAVGLEEDAGPLEVPPVVGRLQVMVRHVDYAFHLLGLAGF